MGWVQLVESLTEVRFVVVVVVVVMVVASEGEGTISVVMRRGSVCGMGAFRRTVEQACLVGRCCSSHRRREGEPYIYHAHC